MIQMNDDGWKVNIKPKIDNKVEDTDEVVETIPWTRRKKIQVLCSLIVLVIGICVLLVFYIKDMNNSGNSHFESLLEGEAYSYAYHKYIQTDEDIEKYDEVVKYYFDELVEKYNQTGDEIEREKVERFNDIYGYKFDIDTYEFSMLKDSKDVYKYSLEAFDAGRIMEAYNYLLLVNEKDSNYESAKEYMKKIKEEIGNKVLSINMIYSEENDRKIAQKIADIYKKGEADIPYKVEFKYTKVKEDELDYSVPKGEMGVIFRNNTGYFEGNSVSYALGTQVLVYNKDYYSELDMEKIEIILAREIDIPNIYIPLTDGKLLAGLISAYDFYMYNNSYLEGDEYVYTDEYEMSIPKYDLAALMDEYRKLGSNENVYTEEDGIEKFMNGEVAAAIVDSDECEKLSNKLGDKFGISTLPYISCEGTGLQKKEKRMQGILECKSVIFKNENDDISIDVAYKIDMIFWEQEFAEFLADEIGAYSEYANMPIVEGSYLKEVQEQCTANYNNVEYGNPNVKKKIDELAAFSQKATSYEEIYQYVNNLEWLKY